MIRRLILIAGIAAVTWPPGTCASVVAPVAIASDTNVTDFSPAGRLIDGSGLASETGGHYWADSFSGNQAYEFSWVTNEVPGYPRKYDFAGEMPRLVMDLGSDIALDGIFLWGYSWGAFGGPQANSMQEFSLRFATDAEGSEGFGSSIGFNPTYEMEPNNVPSDYAGAPGYIVPREDFPFGETIVARWVELTPLDNFWGQIQSSSNLPFVGGDRVAFGEVRFSQVPEPTSGFLFSGLAIAGIVVVRRYRRLAHGEEQFQGKVR